MPEPEVLSSAAPVEPNMWYFGIGKARPSGKIKALDGDIRLIVPGYAKTDPPWFHQIGNPMRLGVPVKTRHTMTRFRWFASSTTDVVWWKYYLLVSGEFKRIVESFEPGIHQFIPVDFVGTRGAIVAQMYALIPNAALRCFSKLSIGFCPIGWEQHWGDHVWGVEGSCHHPRRILEDEAVRSHHLWVAVDFIDRPILVSHALRKALIEADLTNLHFSPAESRECMRWMLPETIKSELAAEPPWVGWLAKE